MLPKAIGHFTILDKIGQGGMGEVYRARDNRLDRTVAIKVLPVLKGSDQEHQRRFVQEAKAASALNHPNIITVHEILFEDGMYCIVMEHVDGKPLDKLIPDNKGMALKELLRAAIQIADALSAAHAAGIIHRDIKPSNVMVRPDGLVKVLDFGLAKLTEQAEQGDAQITRTAAETQEGTVVGTLGYMSPEQVESKKIDSRSDIFSFGALLFEMATGLRAFQGSSRMATMSAVLRDDPRWPDERAQDLPPELSRITNRCLRKDPERRFQTVKEVKIALDELREDSESGRLNAPAVKPARRSRALVIVGAAAVVLAALGVLGWRLMPASGAKQQHLSLKLRPLSDDQGTTTFPSISPDGKLVTYASDRAGDSGLDIWVQQLASGAAPIRLTREPSDEVHPQFSRDGSQIAFVSRANGGGLYVIPSLGGEQRLIYTGAVSYPNFSPDDKWIAVGPATSASPNAYIVPVDGGKPRRIAEGFREIKLPIWSPDGSQIVFAGVTDKSEIDWWIIASEGGTATPLGFGRLSKAQDVVPRQWLDGHIVFSDGDIGRVRILPNPWRVEGPIDYFTSSPGAERDPSAIHNPRDPSKWMVTFATVVVETDLWELNLDPKTGRPTAGGARKALPSQTHTSAPGLSADGKRFSYIRSGLEGWELHARDLINSSDRVLARSTTAPRARLSPDGTFIAMNPRFDDEDGKAINLVSWTSGESRRLCDDCGLIYDWAPDSRHILYRTGQPMAFHQVNVESGKHQLLLGDAPHSLAGFCISPDGRWVALHYAAKENIRQIFIAALRDGAVTPRRDWISVMDRPGINQRPWWSNDGRFLYFLSSASRKQVIWAQELEPVSKRPVREPFPVYSPPFDRMFLQPGPLFGPAMSSNRMVFPINEQLSNIWLGE